MDRAAERERNLAVPQPAGLCHAHNVPPDFEVTDRPYGIRVTLPLGDPMRRILGEDWETYHSFASERERNEALRDMRGEHLYSRVGDRPRIVCEPVQREDVSAEPS